VLISLPIAVGLALPLFRRFAWLALPIAARFAAGPLPLSAGSAGRAARTSRC
jgi:hypothetical protein